MAIKKIFKITLIFSLIISLFGLFTGMVVAKEHKQEIVTFTKEEVRVVDGDTVVITKDNKKLKIRLQGIDAPESSQTCVNKDDNVTWNCGIKAGDILGEKLKLCDTTNKCYVMIIGTDKYRRSLGIIKIGEGKDIADINQYMVRNGWAVAYRQYSTAYVNDEEKANIEKKGIWSSEFTMPSDFRHGKKDKMKL